MYYLGVSAFLAIVKEQSLRAAADSIHVSPSAISYRLKELEQKLGVTLIERHKGVDSIRVTASGKAFLPLAERFQDVLNDIDRFGVTNFNLHLNISAPNSMNMYLLPPLYSMLYQCAPRMTLRIHTEHTEESVESVSTKVMDIAFLAREVSVPSNVLMSPFTEEGFCLLRRSGPSREEPTEVNVAQLDPEKEIFWRWSKDFQLWHERTLGSLQVRRVQLDMASLIPDLLVDEQQWSIVVNSVGEWVKKIRPDEFVVESIKNAPPARKYFKITHKQPSAEVCEGLSMVERCLTTLF